MKFLIRTLGCKMNALDSARIAAALQAAGHEPVSNENDADFVFVNTCTVTAEADRKSRKEVSSFVRKVERVAVMGCGPRVDHVQWEIQAPQGLVFADEKAIYARFGVDPEQLPFPLTSRTRLPIAIQTGCDNACSFCITKVARGRHHTLPAATVIAQIREAREAGVSEVVLTGINLAAWGAEDSNRAEQARLHELLEQILEQTDIPRIRLSSIGPQYLHSGFFDVFADSRICAYLHLSLQSGSDTVLQRMDRGHGSAEALLIAERARAVRPDVGLAADIIAGFPGETRAEHRQGMELLETVAFAKLHVFPFSVREGTLAAALPGQVAEAERKARAAELRELGRQLRRRFIEGQLNRRFAVLAEAGGTGLTGNYIRVNVPGTRQGDLVELTLNTEIVAERL